MAFDPHVHHRRTIRLQEYDYSSEGFYFVTICVQNRECLLGEIAEGEMWLNENGKLVANCWNEIPEHFTNVVLHEFCVMPNHIHGIIEIRRGELLFAQNSQNVQHFQNATENSEKQYQGEKYFAPTIAGGTSGTIGSIVRGLKIGVTKQIGRSIWQRNYYEHIIRNQHSYEKIAEYIGTNALLWGTDSINPANTEIVSQKIYQQ